MIPCSYLGQAEEDHGNTGWGCRFQKKDAVRKERMGEYGDRNA
jgi:hypothetical protein